MAHILKRLCLPVGSYVKEDGKKQTQYREIGVLMEFERDDGSCWQEVRLHADILSPSELAFARGEMEKGSAMARVRLFDLNGTKKKPEPTTTDTPAASTGSTTPGPVSRPINDDTDGDIPF